MPDSGLDFTQDFTTPPLDINDEYEVLGNPFDQGIDLSETLPDLESQGFSPTVAVWDPTESQYALITQGDPGDTLPAFNSFVVQRTTVGSGATSLTFNADGRTDGERMPPIGARPPLVEPIVIGSQVDTVQAETPRAEGLSGAAAASSAAASRRRHLLRRHLLRRHAAMHLLRRLRRHLCDVICATSSAAASSARRHLLRRRQVVDLGLKR